MGDGDVGAAVAGDALTGAVTLTEGVPAPVAVGPGVGTTVQPTNVALNTAAPAAMTLNPGRFALVMPTVSGAHEATAA